MKIKPEVFKKTGFKIFSIDVERRGALYDSIRIGAWDLNSSIGLLGTCLKIPLTYSNTHTNKCPELSFMLQVCSWHRYHFILQAYSW